MIHEKAVTVLWRHAHRRPQAPSPRVAAVRRQVHELQHDLAAHREVRSSREYRAHAPPEGEERATAPKSGPAQQCARRQVAPHEPHRLAQNLGSFPQWQACAPQPVVRERPPHEGFIVQGQLNPGDLRRPWHPG